MNAPAPATMPEPLLAPIEKVFLGENYRKHHPPNWSAKLDELAASMKAKGQLQAVLCRPRPKGKSGELEVIFGERRWRAAKLAGLAELRVEVRDIDDGEVLELQVIENNQREDPHPLDEADGFHALTKRGVSPQEIADKLGRDLRYVVTRLRLVKLSKKCRAALDKEEISLGVAVLLASLPNEKLQDEGLDQVGGGGSGRFGYEGLMSVADARAALEANVMLALKSAPFKTDDATLVPAAGACTTCTKRTGNQAELFADASSKDLCTDPYCHRSKVDALFQLRVKKHKAAGGEVLPVKDAKALLGESWGERHNELERRYAQLDERVYTRTGSKTLKSLFKGELPPVTLAQNPKTGELVELVARKDADRAKGEGQREGRPQVSAATQAANRREKLKDQARAEATRRVVAGMVRKAEGLLIWESFGDRFLAALTRCALASTWHDGQSALVKRRAWFETDDPKAKNKSRAKKSPDDVIEEKIRKATARELGGILVELLASRGAPARYSEKPGEEWSALAEALGEKYDVEHANVVEEQRQAEQAKAAKGKPKAKAAAKGKAAKKRKA